MVAFVIWVVTIALVYALMVGQSQSGALTGVVRVSGMRTVILAGQSALVEAAYALAHPSGGESAVLEGIRGGGSSGVAHEPEGTRALYDADVKAGRLTIEPVKFSVAKQPAGAGEPYHIDLSVRVNTVFAGTKISRQIRRRVLGEIFEIRGQLGPDKGELLYAALTLQGRPLFEVIEP